MLKLQTSACATLGARILPNAVVASAALQERCVSCLLVAARPLADMSTSSGRRGAPDEQVRRRGVRALRVQRLLEGSFINRVGIDLAGGGGRCKTPRCSHNVLSATVAQRDAQAQRTAVCCLALCPACLPSSGARAGAM